MRLVAATVLVFSALDAGVSMAEDAKPAPPQEADEARVASAEELAPAPPQEADEAHVASAEELASFDITSTPEGGAELRRAISAGELTRGARPSAQTQGRLKREAAVYRLRSASGGEILYSFGSRTGVSFTWRGDFDKAVDEGTVEIIVLDDSYTTNLVNGSIVPPGAPSTGWVAATPNTFTSSFPTFNSVGGYQRSSHALWNAQSGSNCGKNCFGWDSMVIQGQGSPQYGKAWTSYRIVFGPVSAVPQPVGWEPANVVYGTSESTCVTTGISGTVGYLKAPWSVSITGNWSRQSCGSSESTQGNLTGGQNGEAFRTWTSWGRSSGWTTAGKSVAGAMMVKTAGGTSGGWVFGSYANAFSV